MEGERQLGRVRWFDNRRGYGFITVATGPDLFVHFAGICGDGYRSLRPGMVVSFRAVAGPLGPAACEVRALPRRRRSEVSAPDPGSSSERSDLP